MPAKPKKSAKKADDETEIQESRDRVRVSSPKKTRGRKAPEVQEEATGRRKKVQEEEEEEVVVRKIIAIPKHDHLEVKVRGSAVKKPPIKQKKVVRKQADPQRQFLGRITPEAREERRIESYARAKAKAKERSMLAKDIGALPEISEESWKRRLAAKNSLKVFAETYMPSVFYRGWSDDQMRCVTKAERVILRSGMFCLAMPRGGGKTAICRAAILWAMAYGYRRFIYFIGSTDEKSKQSLEFVKTYWYRNQLLQTDFPEIGYPVLMLENSHHKCKAQTYMGENTFAEWSTGSIRLPSLILPKEVAEEYEARDPGSTKYIPDRMVYVPKQAGIIITSSGIDGSIRGEALVNPITLEQPRPDLVLLDDVQKEQKADSPILCEKLVRMIDGAVQGLAGPGEHIAALMPCTVIREGDVADQYLDMRIKPEWQGERCAMVKSWPEGITDIEITDATPAAKLWNEYAEIYRKSLRDVGDISLATEFYKKNREVMDAGFECSWAERYTREGIMAEISAQQHAMNLRLKLGPMFLSEFQNRGRKLQAEGEIMITAEQLAAKTINCNEFEVPEDTQKIVAHIDVQMEIMYYTIFATNMDFTGMFTTYGTWPDIQYRYFIKDQTRSWSLMSTAFFQKHPQYRHMAIKTNEGHMRAPLDAKIYWGLGQIVNKLRGMKFIRTDKTRTPLTIDKISIDTRWGETSEVVKRFIKESGIKELLPYYGQDMAPTKRQFEEYELRKGWLFEHQVTPHVREPKWCVKPNPDGMLYMMADVDRLKDFLFARLATPMGQSGCVTLYRAPAEQHELFSHHICNSEFPEPVSARGMVKNKWTVREGVSYDNDFLDCACGNMALAGLLGVSVKTTDQIVRSQPRKLAEVYQRKRGA